MKLSLRSTLLLFYGSFNIDCYICLNDDNKLPSIIVRTDLTSEEIAKNLFQSITNIDKNWLGIKIAQAYTREYDEDGNRIVDINYIGLLQGRQELLAGFKWVKIRELKDCGFSEEHIKFLAESISRRF